MKKTVLVLTTLLVSSACLASAENASYVEFYGSSVYPSVNYERITNNDDYAWRIGAGYDSTKAWSVPVGMFRLLGQNNHKFEAGVGMTYVKYTHDQLRYGYNELEGYTLNKIEMNRTALKVYPSVGYRYMPHSDGIIFRSTFSPFVTKQGLEPTIGLSLGYRF